MWFQSLQMTSATSGWALDFSASPAEPAAGARMLLARTVDSARAWADVTPSAARPMLATAFGSEILDPVDDEHAYLAVTAATQDTSNNVPNTTAVFATTGWLTISCRSGAYLVVTRDGGTTWTKQPLPLAADPCSSAGGPCDITGPRFAGATGFLTVAPAASSSAPFLLVSHDRGLAWQSLALPSGAGMYPQIRFFGPADGVLVAAGSQEALGSVFYTTADGGHTWKPVRQGRRFTQHGATIDFASPQVGFAWTQGGDTRGSAPPPLYATANSGLTWHFLIPRLTS